MVAPLVAAVAVGFSVAPFFAMRMAIIAGVPEPADISLPD